jgi:hypothetical protein
MSVSSDTKSSDNVSASQHDSNCELNELVTELKLTDLASRTQMHSAMRAACLSRWCIGELFVFTFTSIQYHV